jgi:hypothetical protein
MTSVNELPQRWMPEHYEAEDEWTAGVMAGRESCALDLQKIARTVWHPVSEPPTEADGNIFGMVVYAYCKSGEWHVWQGRWHGADNTVAPDLWARVRDVVLMPEGDDGTS